MTEQIRTEMANVFPPNPAPEVRQVAAPNGDGSLFVVRNDYKVERLLGPRCQRRVHNFDDLRSFAKWLQREAQPEICDILVNDEGVDVALDPMVHKADRVTCDLAVDPAFAAWRRAFEVDRGLDQRRFHSLVRARRGDLSHEIAEMLLYAIRNLAVTKTSDRVLRLTEQGSIQVASNAEKRTFEATVPGSFVVTCPVYEGVERPVGGDLWAAAEYEIEVLVTLDDAADVVTFKLEAPNLPAILRRARREAAVYLAHLLGEPFLVALGVLELEECAAVAVQGIEVEEITLEAQEPPAEPA